MGVVYKLKPKLRDFILKQKRDKSRLSCRGLSALVEKKFQIKLGKSWINQLIKQTGLSSPTGRRRKRKRVVSPTVNIILRAAEALLGSRFQPELFREGLCLSIIFSGGQTFYLDAQLHTIWPSPNIPVDFALTISKLNSYIDRYFKKDHPLVLLNAPGYPGYKVISQEFIDFLDCWQSGQKHIERLFILGAGMQEVIPALSQKEINPTLSRGIIFGLWPGQFMRSSKIKNLTEFKPFSFAPLERDFYLAEAEVKLLQPKLNQTVTLRGCLLKNSLSDETSLIICTNMPAEKLGLNQLAEEYLVCWPNFKEGFQAANHKIELFTYTGGLRQTFFEEVIAPKDPGRIQKDYPYYSELLSAFLCRYCLPLEYENMGFSTVNKRFYSFVYERTHKQDSILIKFTPPSDFAFAGDLNYLCRRLNERQVILGQKRIWFKTNESGFKK